MPKNALYPGVSVPPTLFQKQIKYLTKRGYQSFLQKDWQSALRHPKAVVLTFDDGYEDFYTTAAPMMNAVQFRGTVFLVSQHIGGVNQWDIDLGEVPAPLMNRDQILELHAKGYEFGSHTRTHAKLHTLEEPEQIQEITESKAELERLLGFEIETFCYPYGSYDHASVAAVRNAGYQSAASTQKGINDASTFPFLLKRIAIRNDTSLPVFIYKLWRAYRFGK